ARRAGDLGSCRQRHQARGETAEAVRLTAFRRRLNTFLGADKRGSEQNKAEQEDGSVGPAERNVAECQGRQSCWACQPSLPRVQSSAVMVLNAPSPRRDSGRGIANRPGSSFAPEICSTKKKRQPIDGLPLLSHST